MKKVLFITRHYLSDNNGGANATKGFVHAFCRIFDDLTLIYPEHDDQDNSSFVPAQCHCLPCFDQRSKVMKGLDVYRGRLHRLTDFVRQHISMQHYDVIVLDHSLTAASIINNVVATGARIITIHHNVERDYLKDNLPPLPYRFPMVHFSEKAERDALLKSHLNLTLTQRDAETFQSWYPEKNLHLNAIGICEYRGIPEKHIDPVAGIGRFVISGSLCFQQSLEPIIQFVQQYYPVLKELCPSATLTIAGRNPSQALYDACEKWPDIQIVPNPEDMSDVIRGADAYICPISAGSGIKLRLMDGLKEGRPILCHEISTCGYEPLLEAGAIRKYNDVDSFKTALIQTLNQKHDATQIYNLFRQHFSIDALAERIANSLKDLQ